MGRDLDETLLIVCSIFFNGIHFCFQRFKIARNSRMCLEGSKDDIVRRTNIRSMENEGFYLRHMADACLSKGDVCY